jgi:hypothetical protein
MQVKTVSSDFVAIHGETHNVVGLEVGVFLSFSPFDLLFFFLTLIFCNFLEMVMCQNGIGGCKMPLLQMDQTQGVFEREIVRENFGKKEKEKKTCEKNN